MNNTLRSRLLLASTLVWTQPGQAHDPAMHQPEGESPNCLTMTHMEGSDLSEEDPILQAMRQQCATEYHEHAEETPPSPDEAQHHGTDDEKPQDDEHQPPRH